MHHRFFDFSRFRRVSGKLFSVFFVCSFLLLFLLSGDHKLYTQSGEPSQEFADSSMRQRVQVNDVFSVRIILITEQDIIVLSSLDKGYLEEVHTLRGEGEVLFVFRAVQPGTTELLFDRIQSGSSDDYLSYTVEIVASTEKLTGDASSGNTKANTHSRRPSSQTKKNSDANNNARALVIAKLLREVIATGDVASAERAFAGYENEMESDFPYRTELLLALAELYQKADRLPDAYQLVLGELERGTNELSVTNFHALTIMKGQLERLQGELEKAFDTWVLLKENLTQRMAEEGRGKFFSVYAQNLFELGETSFALNEYKAAEQEYQSWLMLYERAQKKPMLRQHFLVYTRLASIYEEDEVLRDYKKVYEYYLHANDLGIELRQYEDAFTSELNELTNFVVERLQFIKDYFINIR